MGRRSSQLGPFFLPANPSPPSHHDAAIVWAASGRTPQAFPAHTFQPLTRSDTVLQLKHEAVTGGSDWRSARSASHFPQARVVLLAECCVLVRTPQSRGLLPSSSFAEGYKGCPSPGRFISSPSFLHSSYLSSRHPYFLESSVPTLATYYRTLPCGIRIRSQQAVQRRWGSTCRTPCQTDSCV